MKALVIAIVKYLRLKVQSGELSPDAAEGIEVAIQCIEAAFNINQQDLEAPSPSLLEIYQRHTLETGPASVSQEQREEAESLKLLGNSLMRENQFEEAIASYTRAIGIDPFNAVYYCNRAAAHIKLSRYAAAIEDCNHALRIDPRYSKAHSRLGFAHSAMKNFAQAKLCYRQALELEPENESYRASLSNIEEQLAGPSSASYPEFLPGLDISGLLRSPGFASVAGQMLADPEMQNVVSRLLTSQQFPLGNVEDLITAGQEIAERLQTRGSLSPRQGQQSSEGIRMATNEGEGIIPDILLARENEEGERERQITNAPQVEVPPDVVQQAIDDLPPAVMPIEPENRNLQALDLAPVPAAGARPLVERPEPPIEVGEVGDSVNVQNPPPQVVDQEANVANDGNVENILGGGDRAHLLADE